MLQNAYILAKIGADTAENEQHVAEILQKTGNYPTGSSDPSSRAADVVSDAAVEASVDASVAVRRHSGA